MGEPILQLGQVKDLTVLRADFTDGRTIRLQIRVYPKVESGSPLSEEPDEISLARKQVYHDDLMEALRPMRLHLASLSGSLGRLSNTDFQDWSDEDKAWWEDKMADCIRIDTIIWTGGERNKVKLLGMVTVVDGHKTNISTPTIDLDRSGYAMLPELNRELGYLEEELNDYLGGKYAGIQLDLFTSAPHRDESAAGEGIEIEHGVTLHLPPGQKLLGQGTKEKTKKKAAKGGTKAVPKGNKDGGDEQ